MQFCTAGSKTEKRKLRLKESKGSEGKGSEGELLSREGGGQDQNTKRAGNPEKQLIQGI